MSVRDKIIKILDEIVYEDFDNDTFKEPTADAILEIPEIKNALKPNPFYKSQMTGTCWICKRPRNICSC